MKVLLGLLAVVAVGALVVVGSGVGRHGGRVQANPSKIWVINDQVLQGDDGGLCGGVCDPTTAAGRALFTSTLDAVQADSSDPSGSVRVELCTPGCSLPPPAGDTWILVQTDGSGTAVFLNGRGLGCSPLCNSITAQVPDVVDHFAVYRVADTGTHACGDTIALTATEDSVQLQSEVVVITDGCGTPTPTPTPANTTLVAPAQPGDTEIQVASADGFHIGDLVTINPNGGNEESAVVTGFGSLTLDRPLQCAHAVGEFVEVVSPFGNGVCSPTPTPTPDCTQQTSPPIAGCPTGTPFPTATATPTPDCSHPTSPPSAGCADPDGDGVPDFLDNCPDTANADQLNTDAANTAANRPGADQFGDACDADIDGDGYSNVVEFLIGTNLFSYCAIIRADVDGDGAISILDLATVAQSFLQSVPPAPARYKQDADNSISILDLATMSQYFLQNYRACP